MKHRCSFASALFAVALLFASPALAESAETPDVPDEVRAYAIWQQGYLLHLSGRFETAVKLFRESIAVHPTAEGHTFLGWSLSKLGHIEDALAQCKKAIALDPDYGNPYNEIGVYLIDLGRPDDAVPWFEKAIRSKRYCCYQFPHFNLGRVLLMQGDIEVARQSFERSLEHEPDYAPARLALEYLKESLGEPL